MHNPTFRCQGDPVTVDWSIGRAPLSLRGIRFAEGEGGAPPAAPPAAGTGATPPAANPAQLAAFYASQNGAQTPPPAPAPPAAAPQPIQGFTPEQVQKLMADSAAAQKAAADAQAALTQAQSERDEAKGQVSQFQRDSAVRGAAGTTANADLLLDSAKFQAVIKDVDLADTTALTAAVSKFVTENPVYAAGPAAPQLPNTSGGTPAGGTTDKPTTLAGALAAAAGA